jgi:hypothetical protein
LNLSLCLTPRPSRIPPGAMKVSFKLMPKTRVKAQAEMKYSLIVRTEQGILLIRNHFLLYIVTKLLW